MPFKPLLIILLLSSMACRPHAVAPEKNQRRAAMAPLPDDNPYPSIAAIPLPDGYTRITTASGSFGAWLRQVPLKKEKQVHLFDGSLKSNQSAQFAVLNISVGDKNLQQCADAVMRLRAEYLFAVHRFDAIDFMDNAGTHYRFGMPFTREHFGQYLERVFGRCGSASLARQLLPQASPGLVAPGDVLIRGGFPGHAVIVMDVAVNAANERIFLLAQSYMPAQDIHVLLNPMDENLSPWYKAGLQANIITPEYIFSGKEWKGWGN